VGDYIINNELYERKSAEDFISSMTSRRLWNQIHQLKEQENYKVAIALTGNVWKALFKSNVRPNENTYFGLIHTIEMKYELPILNFYDDKEFVHYLKYVDQKGGKNGKMPGMPVRKSKDNVSLMIDALSCIKTVSTVRAHQLLDYFGNVKNVANATIEDLEGAGFTRKVSENIYNFFNKK